MTYSSKRSSPLCGLSNLIEHRRALGDAGALRIGDEPYSYGQLAALVEQHAAALLSVGVTAGELVLCPSMPVLDSLLMQWALARLGVAMLPIRNDLAGARRDSLIQTTGAEWCWKPAEGDTGLAPMKGAALRAEMPVKLASNPTLSASLTTVLPDAATTPAVLVETSGSSTDPKIVMLSAANIVASCLAVNARLDLKLGDRWLCALPRHHVGGLAISYRCALAGAELMVQSRFKAEAVQTALRDAQITHLSLVPAMLERLLNIDPTPPPRLKVALLGGQGLDARLARRAVEHGWPIYLGYGMTETFSQVAGDWIGADGLPLRGLMPLDGVELDCPSCDQDRHQAPQPAKPLRIRGPMLMLGYANPTRTPGVGLDDGWLQTSDLACRLPGSGLDVLGRADDVVLIAGLNVLPADIERQLARLEQIADIAVIGVSDPTWGHRLVALYVGDFEPAQLEVWCRSHLPSHLRPRLFARMEHLPTLSSGKRDRRALMVHAEVLAQRADQSSRQRSALT